jgi:hypothetical protein
VKELVYGRVEEQEREREGCSCDRASTCPLSHAVFPRTRLSARVKPLAALRLKQNTTYNRKAPLSSAYYRNAMGQCGEALSLLLESPWSLQWTANAIRYTKW